MRLVDSHAHLDFEDYGSDRADVLARARAAGLVHIVNVGLWREGKGAEAASAAVRLAEELPAMISAAVGIHPHDVARATEADWARIGELARHPRVVAVGETGLDYHYDHSPREAQQEAFRRSIALAREVKKPVIVHLREADDDCARILAEERPAHGGVIHCFTGGPARARAYLDLGFVLSVAGVVTFRNADDLRAAVRIVPRDRLMVETDCPYLTPVPHRGKRNEPAYVALVAKQVAAQWGLPEDEVGEATTQTARRLFSLPIGSPP